MLSAKEIYQDDGYFSDYQPMLKQFGEIVVQVDDDDYQGDSRVLYESEGRYGYLCFGWGSCSGCDALQGCGTIEEVQALMNELFASIIWFDSKPDALEFFNTHDWEGDWAYSEDFILQCKNALK